MTKDELTFSIFIIHILAKSWNKTSIDVYHILNKTEILDNYIIKCYDVLHTLGEQYLIQDITEFAREKGADI